MLGDPINLIDQYHLASKIRLYPGETRIQTSLYYHTEPDGFGTFLAGISERDHNAPNQVVEQRTNGEAVEIYPLHD